MKIKLLTLLIIISSNNILLSNDLMNPTSYSKDLYQIPILDGTYTNGISHPDKFLGFAIGERVAAPWQITSALKEWSNQSNKIKVVEYARTHENRPLHAVFISSPDNINNLDAIKDNISKLADARNTNDREARSIIDNMPAIAWMAYSIHGNETSGADGALAAIFI
jgi:Zinc carboxypeptidase.